MLIAQPAHCNLIVVAETPARHVGYSVRAPALHIPLLWFRRTGPPPRFNSSHHEKGPQMNADKRR